MPGLTAFTSAPRWVELQLTERCNLRCSLCYEWGESGSYRGRADTAELDFDALQRVVDDYPIFDLFNYEFDKHADDQGKK